MHDQLVDLHVHRPLLHPVSRLSCKAARHVAVFRPTGHGYMLMRTRRALPCEDVRSDFI